MERDELVELVRSRLDVNLFRHSLAVEAVMKGIARKFNKDEEIFGIAGLVHDIDLDTTKDKPQLHSIVGSEFLKSIGIMDDVVEAVKKHNPSHNLKRETLLEKALYAVDPLTGLITACALVKGKKLDGKHTDWTSNFFPWFMFDKNRITDPKLKEIWLKEPVTDAEKIVIELYKLDDEQFFMDFSV